MVPSPLNTEDIRVIQPAINKLTMKIKKEDIDPIGYLLIGFLIGVVVNAIGTFILLY